MARGEDAGLVDELKIDKDCVVDQDWLEDYVRLIVVPTCRSYGAQVLSVRMCLSRVKGFHLYVRIAPAIQSELANRLQFLLGDDCERVDFNRARIEVGFKEWNKLFWTLGKRLRTIYRAADHEKTAM